jgi:DNA end-binding protein Ku
MVFGDVVLSPDRLDELDAIGEAEASDRELRMAQQLIESLSNDFDPTSYHDEYRERVLELIERKASGEEIAAAPEVEEPAAAPDLMAALEASLAAVKSDGEPAHEAPAPRKRKSATTSNGKSDAKKPARAKR